MLCATVSVEEDHFPGVPVPDDAKVPTKHITQYFEMFGHRSVYHDGWRAVCPWPGTSFKEAGIPFGAPIDKDKLTELDAKSWELYHIETDFAENHTGDDIRRLTKLRMIRNTQGPLVGR